MINLINVIMKSGDIVNLKDLQEYFDSNNGVKFKLYNMNYIIEKKDDYIDAYAEDFPGRKEQYRTFKDAVNNFKIYNEPLLSQLDSIQIINKDDE